MKKLISVILAVVLVLSLGASAFADYNYKAVSWELSRNGVLTISGYGDMPDYTKNPAPWEKLSAKIKKVVIEEGVTSIGAEAFEYCENLTEVKVADSVERFGDYAFYDCIRLKKINFPENLREIGKYCFDHCGKIESAVIPYGTEVIGECTFNCCYKLEWVSIPGTVELIEESAFNACESLETVYFSGSPDDWAEIEVESYNKPLTRVSVVCEW